MAPALLAALWVAIAPVAGTATLTRAEEPTALTTADARWTADGKIALSATWQGSACEAPGEPSVEAASGDATMDLVVIPTIATSEVCTMQIVTVEFAGEVPVEPNTERVAILVLAPDGRPVAQGAVAISPAD